MPKQLLFEFMDELAIPQELPQKQRPPQLVKPTDITFFLTTYLPEYKEDILGGKLSEGAFNMPCLAPVHDIKPELLVPFNAVMSLKPQQKTSCFPFFHFFIHDYQFERLWSNPTPYVPFLKSLNRGIGPDHSMFHYMHPSELLINCCRNRMMAFFLQRQGVLLIPNACFGRENTLQWAFDGLPENSVLATGSISCMEDGMVKRSFLNGLHELDRKKHPEILYVYGEFPEEWKDKFKMEIRTLPTFTAKWRRCNNG